MARNSLVEHYNDFCAYLGIVNWKEVSHLEQELQSDLTLEASNDNLEPGDFKNALTSNIFGHLFKCLHCGKHS